MYSDYNNVRLALAKQSMVCACDVLDYIKVMEGVEPSTLSKFEILAQRAIANFTKLSAKLQHNE